MVRLCSEAMRYASRQVTAPLGTKPPVHHQTSGYTFRSRATWHLFNTEHLRKANCTKPSLNEEGHAGGRPRIRRGSTAPAQRAAVWLTKRKSYKHFTHPRSERVDGHRRGETPGRAEEQGGGREAEPPPPAPQDPCSDLCQSTSKCKSPSLRCWPSPGDPQSCSADGAVYRAVFPSQNCIVICIKGFNDFWHTYRSLQRRSR